MSAFKVGDKVRVAIKFRNGETGTVVLATDRSANVSLDSLPGQFPLNFHNSELELVKPEPLFAVGDRVELAGVTGEVSYMSSIDPEMIEVKWSDGNFNAVAGELLKQLKKLPPEQVFVTGAWYKHKALRTSRFLLAPAGWYQFSGDDLGFVAGPIESIGSFQEHLVEVDFPL